MGKQAKIPQTDYTKGGRDISNTAIPAYRTNIGRIDDYLSDPDKYIQSNLNKYYTNTTEQNDFLTNYERGMGNVTANNYAATGGGYSSAGDMAFKDAQAAYDKAMARLYDQGVQNAANMANQYYTNLLYGNQSLNDAYRLGEEYSDIEQKNAIIDAQNKNWFGNILGGAGKVLSSIPAAPTQILGGAMQVGGNLATTDTSLAQQALGMGSTLGAGVGGAGGAYLNPWDSTFNNIYGGLTNYVNKSPSVPSFLTPLKTSKKQKEGTK